MRKFILFVSMGLCAACSWAGVKVELKGFDNDSVQVRWYNPVSRARIAQDSLVVANNGKFVLADVKEPALILLLPRQYAGRDAAQLYVAPGEKFDVKLTKGADGMDVVTKGSKLQAMIDEVSAQREALGKLINGEKDEAKRDSLISLYYKVTTDYVEQNLDSPITLWALSMTDVEFCEKMLPKVGANAKTGMFAGLDQKLAERIKREKEVQAAKKLTAEGEMAPDFELPTPDGSTLKMSSLRGKWVIVDFWGSWCIWCIRGIPQLKENYEKYKDKMEILSIACRDKKDKWLAAIEKHQLNWKHVISEGAVPGSDKSVEMMYGIEGYPTKLLVNPEGKIVKRCVGEDPKFYDDFADLIK